MYKIFMLQVLNYVRPTKMVRSTPIWVERSTPIRNTTMWLSSQLLVGKYVVANLSTLRKLPNEVVMAKKLLETMENYRYDFDSKTWLLYNPKEGLWVTLDSSVVNNLVFRKLDDDQNLHGILTMDYRNKIVATLQEITGVHFNDCRANYKDLGLIPILCFLHDMLRNLLQLKALRGFN